MPATDFFDLIADLTGGVTLPDGAAGRALAAALAIYGQDAPRYLAWARVTEDGRHVPLPPEWTHGVSVIEAITVAVDGDVPHELPPGGWAVVATVDGPAVRLARPVTPGAALDIAYTAGHVVNDSEDGGIDTVPLIHRLAVAGLAASVALTGLAAAHAADTPAVVGVTPLPGAGDSPSRNYAARAKELRSQYYTTLGIDPEARAAVKTAIPGFAAAEVSVAVNRPPGGRLFRRDPGLTIADPARRGG